MQFVLRWWLILEIFGWLALPLAMRIFSRLPDRGYTLSKALGLLVISYTLWLGASTGLLNNDTGGILFSMGLAGGLSAWLLWKSGSGEHPEESILEFLRRQRRLVITSEVLFFLALLVWAGLRAYAPDKIMNAGGEKFMEITFMNGILNSHTFPPLDPWLSGFSISYYYFGYVMMALLTRLSGVPSGVGFDLTDAMLFALTSLGAFGVAYNLVARSIQRLKLKDDPVAWRAVPGAAMLFALLGALMTTLMANLEGVLEVLHNHGLLSAGALAWLDIPDLAVAPISGSWFPGDANGWWWWRGSRVLQDYNLLGQRQGISPITEFPFFSFLLGDNHPHVLGLPFVLLAIAFAFNLYEEQLQRDRQAPSSAPWWNIAAYCLEGDWVLFFSGALILGGLAFNNTWDFPIYLGLALLAYAAGRLAGKTEIRWGDLLAPVVLAVGWLIGAVGLYVFFYLSFSSQAGGLLPYIFPPTRLVQYLVMFGPFIFIVLAFLLTYSLRHRLSLRSFGAWWLRTAGVGAGLVLVTAAGVLLGGQIGANNPLLQSAQQMLGGASWSSIAAKIISDRLAEPWMFLLVSALLALALSSLFLQLPRLLAVEPAGRDEPSGLPVLPGDLFIFLLIFTALALTWVTEFVYLRDSFGLRMNTIFKFYYQAWIMLAMACAYGLWWLSEQRFFQSGGFIQSVLLPAVGRGGALILVLLGLVYTVQAADSRVANFRFEPDLNGESSLALSNQDDWAAIAWFKDNAIGQTPLPVILEAPGKSYNYEGRISAFTGLPAVLGWSLHEGQWRGTYTEQDKREPDIQTIYTTNDSRRALDLLHKWGVNYVVIGATERNYITRVCQAGGCALSSALRKFEAVLTPVFTQGQTIIYAVP